MAENIASTQVELTLKVTRRQNRSRFNSRPTSSVITNRINPTMSSRKWVMDRPMFSDNIRLRP
ncbi:hypothetical protein D3C78_1940880 [compost metagenome]